MFFFKNHLVQSIFLLFILLGCQLQDASKNHGILFLENRSNELVLKKTKTKMM